MTMLDTVICEALADEAIEAAANAVDESEELAHLQAAEDLLAFAGRKRSILDHFPNRPWLGTGRVHGVNPDAAGPRGSEAWIDAYMGGLK